MFLLFRKACSQGKGSKIVFSRFVLTIYDMRIQGVTRGYRGFTRGYKGLEGGTSGDRGWQGITGGYKGL